MWLVIKGLALRFAIGRTVGGVFGTLFLLLVPMAGVLKFVGLPLLLVLGVLGAPIFLLLAAIGLPALFVVGIGGALLLGVGVLLTLSFMVLKILLPILLVVWLVRWVIRKSGTAGPEGGAAA